MRGATGATGWSPMYSSMTSADSQSSVGVEPGPVAEPVEGLGDRLSGDAVKRERERIDRGRDEVGSGLDGRERRCEPDAGGALDVEADGQLARLADAADQLLRAVRDEGAGRVVDDDARGAELGELARLLDERVGLPRAAGAVDEARVERAARARDRGAGLAQVRDVVQRVM